MCGVDQMVVVMLHYCVYNCVYINLMPLCIHVYICIHILKQQADRTFRVDQMVVVMLKIYVYMYTYVMYICIHVYICVHMLQKQADRMFGVDQMVVVMLHNLHRFGRLLEVAHTDSHTATHTATNTATHTTTHTTTHTAILHTAQLAPLRSPS